MQTLNPYKLIYAFLVISAVTFIFSSFKTQNPGKTQSGLIYDYLKDFHQQTILLDKRAQAYKLKNIPQDSLKEALLKTRKSYKQTEFYLAYYYPEYISSHINGAPLLHVETEGNLSSVLNPEGLQVLDEIIFSGDAEKERNQIAILTKRLRTNYEMLYNKLIVKEIHIDINAFRLQLVRIFTMGITGFDTPGSINALPEAEASLAAMKSIFEASYHSSQIVNLFEKAIKSIEGKTKTHFEEFDRLNFLKKYIDPLYNQLAVFQSDKNDNTLKFLSSWNPESNSIFSKNFLNPYKFTQLKESEDSRVLRKLGKKLFYDPILSNNEKMSCASCHQPEKTFTDHISKSVSNVQGISVMRNAPTLLNAVYADRYFYDLRAFTLEQQAEHVIFNKQEFNTAYTSIIKKLEEDPEYSKYFKKAFGNKTINRERFVKALASYVLSLQSFDSTFDKYVRNENKGLSKEAQNGFNLFMGKANCATCHFAPTFSGLVPPFYNENESEILGVLQDPDASVKIVDTDEGRFNNQVNSEKQWIYEKSFKTTTIRNASLTAPYFHNGAYDTLEEVIDFYNEGGGAGMGLKVTNQTLPPDKLDLTQTEKKELIAFIESLNDVSGQ
ncbi:cytochrome-c peroxidase [Abyssalbus ytuae]|uniref:Cytochrome-c peroxidase n=1 Tax=Abyssalbus ytuae TaxID=2926907 RepID=A0A9E7CZ58_9FLAO|nr:cytochrome c peroxidase [Abyssalbus ytuae]UOB17275.1 cytochrome-c peroxidase [Abyssalbus ytuae]